MLEANYHVVENPTIEKILEESSSKAENEIKGENQRKTNRRNWIWLGKKHALFAKEIRSLKADIIHQFSEQHIFFDVFSAVSNLDGLVRFLVDESILYTGQKGKEFHTNEQEIAELLGINYIVFINKLPTIKCYWDCGQSLVTKTLEMFWLDQDLKTSS